MDAPKKKDVDPTKATAALNPVQILRELYATLFGAIYDPFMAGIERRILSLHRRELLGGLTGHILEIGSGSGVNFSYYHAGVEEVLAIEPNEHLSRRARSKLKAMTARPSVTFIPHRVDDTKAIQAIPPGKMDAVVFTLVLCSVPDPEGLLRKTREWLRPGGQVILLEHIRSDHPFEGFLHDLFAPLWRNVADGCNLNRRTDRMMAELSFILREEQFFHFGLPFYRAVYEKPRSQRDPSRHFGKRKSNSIRTASSAAMKRREGGLTP